MDDHTAEVDVITPQSATPENRVPSTPQESADSESQQMSLPLSKIKKIFKMDPDYLGASQGAVYATGLATELFVQYFVEQASLMAKVDKRKKIQYKDFANAVASHDALNFLSDTIPKTHAIGDLIQKKKVNTLDSIHPMKDKEDNHKSSKAPTNVATKPDPILPKGQQILNFGVAPRSEAPVKKAGINDLVSSQNDSDVAESQDVEMKE
ncbi:DPB3 [Candida theae]|uniref:DPB3 n=1 Tax=Candida theae TaxID=1198502 RepID=A0AAD5BJP1_9ASCO|nr:DPB3 [Candida theae]KAI5967447.1 DPB3 [Candida theae]